ncbi:tRNA (N6-isopentenyl adenosine(37)-C2)-methylthiotransferase MiaB [Nitratifractor salsuginis]|uniref:tRNA-2-methylthio-N(6)-dimethylallyladenosine synthase n=1 Tax=Nitratifractor salsuginis (strain DSM 16511 / JCM 12458 / E9I37-1) TaxID=749222 RepID=E6WZ15_NITSE|nr:tRNA (N6-isopentenyl adenosine(37)-C2)-methylthiotransferase MiaB [Nitratifractor salsuginis]ADV45465.1 tRNA-i(6)A37 thiotransferase enzyme MiaB [Nitratifractor salsuginis DSM 16511]
MSKKLYIETLGCAMNVRDTEHMIAELSRKEDYDLTENLEEADLIIINTCSVREKPVAKLFSEIGRFRKQRKEGAKIGVAGCTASHLGEEIIRRAPYVDFVLGARNVSKITKVLNEKHAVEVSTDYDESTYPFGEYRSNPFKAMVNISIGCDKKCTFCIVPATRGDEISIPSSLILQEVKKAVQAGAKEVILLGQNVNNYGRRFSAGEDEVRNFTELLKRVSAVEGLERIRFQSPHPLHMDDAFLEEFASNPKICPQIHVPLQSGSTRLLKRMKRGYSKEWFLDRCERIRAMVPGVAISTDIIVGFPGESEEDFAETMEVVEKVRFDQMFSFRYSPRPMTAAAEYEDQIPETVAAERLKRLQSRQDEITDEIMAAQEGRIHEVYFEELRPGNRVAGRSADGRLVSVEGSEELLGKILPVRITRAMRRSLEGELCK